jgi:hypothetical protein
MRATAESRHDDPMDCDTALHDGLRLVVPVLSKLCVDRWCVIGSAAARLSGIETVVADIDVLCTRRDAETLMVHWAQQRAHDFAPAASDRFRSGFARFHLAALPLEVMGDLEVCVDGLWQRVQVLRLDDRELDGLRVPVPTIEEQIRILEIFGRRKDLERALLLRGLTKRMPPD